MTSPAQIWCRVIGFTLVAAGIAGFFYSSSFDSPGHTSAVLGILAVNGWHNLVHILTGVLALAFAGSYAGARSFSLILAAAYALVAIWGFAIGDGHAILSIVPVNTEDNFLHAFIALVSLVVGVVTPAAPAPSTRAEGRGFRWN